MQRMIAYEFHCKHVMSCHVWVYAWRTQSRQNANGPWFTWFWIENSHSNTKCTTFACTDWNWFMVALFSRLGILLVWFEHRLKLVSEMYGARSANFSSSRFVFLVCMSCVCVCQLNRCMQEARIGNLSGLWFKTWKNKIKSNLWIWTWNRHTAIWLFTLTHTRIRSLNSVSLPFAVMPLPNSKWKIYFHEMNKIR